MIFICYSFDLLRSVIVFVLLPCLQWGSCFKKWARKGCEK